MRFKAILTAILLALLLAPTGSQAGAIFQDKRGGVEFSLFPFWKQIVTDMSAAAPPPIAATPVAAGRTAPGRGPQCANDRRCVPAAWTALLDTLRKKPRREQMNAVNRWANARPYVEDIVNWGVADYWETPGQFLAKGGDCEDFAIFKYYSLVQLGFSPDNLRIVVVNDTNMKVFHAVLAVREEGETWLLDNQIAQIVPFEVAVQYVPIYSLNEHGWWMHSTPRISLGTVTIVAAGPPER
jgi:predicted transglutaminase-like cysteine proteinase